MTGIRMAGIEDYPHVKTNRAEGKGEGHNNDKHHQHHCQPQVSEEDSPTPLPMDNPASIPAAVSKCLWGGPQVLRTTMGSTGR